MKEGSDNQRKLLCSFKNFVPHGQFYPELQSIPFPIFCFFTFHESKQIHMIISATRLHVSGSSFDLRAKVIAVGLQVRPPWGSHASHAQVVCP